MMSIRMIRNVAFGVLVAAAMVGAQKDAFASGCEDVYGTQYVNLVYCGPYDYENDALDSMDGIAGAFCWGTAYYYWHARVGDMTGPGYYDGMWTCA